MWENCVTDDIARMTVVAAHYASNKLNLSSFLFLICLMRSEPPPDPLQGGGGIFGITCLFVTYVGKMDLWEFMLNTVGIQEGTVMSFTHSFCPLM